MRAVSWTRVHRWVPVQNMAFLPHSRRSGDWRKLLSGSECEHCVSCADRKWSEDSEQRFGVRRCGTGGLCFLRPFHGVHQRSYSACSFAQRSGQLQKDSCEARCYPWSELYHCLRPYCRRICNSGCRRSGNKKCPPSCVGSGRASTGRSVGLQMRTSLGKRNIALSGLRHALSAARRHIEYSIGMMICI